MKIAIIPARGGSKRIPKKNIKSFVGKPMISYAIDRAIESGIFSKVFVSTDNKEIAKVAIESGAEVPFFRQEDISDDFTPTVPVVADAVNRLQQLGHVFDDVCCIYPCVPFILTEDLVNSFELFIKNQADYCFPITEFPSATQRALKFSTESLIEPVDKQYELTRTQDLEKTFYDAGQFYWGKANTWLENKTIHSNSCGYILPGWRVMDIDTEDDWKRAEIMNEILHKS